MRKSRLLRMGKNILLLWLLLLLLAPNWPAFGAESHRLKSIVGPNHFDFFVWEMRAITVKASALLTGGQAFLPAETRRQVVLDYLGSIQTISRLNWEIEQIYVNPDIADPETASQPLQAEVAAARATMEQLRPLAEAIIQDQVAELLREEGLAVAGKTWPPVMIHMTPLPSLLITSPREEIMRKDQVALKVGLTTPEKEGMETAVYDNLDLSALVVPIGGLATYPAMIMETSSINWLAEVTAHEWAHHWLMPYPLSLNYLSDPAARTINETVASIVGREIGAQVIQRFYPEFAPPPPAAEAPPLDDAAPPAFDFRAEMAATRITVDALLAAGEVDEAEAYMEERRRLFVANGYNVRKLNQAYFAFYGAYADEPGATGDDPIGPTVLALRENSPSLKAFLAQMAWVGSLADLQEVAEEAGVWATAVNSP